MDYIRIAWLSGLLEGEGYFAYSPHYQRDRERWPKPSYLANITMASTDHDVVAMVKHYFGGNVTGPYWAKKSTKPYWNWSINGRNAAAIMMTIYSFLGSRRRAKILSILAAYKAGPLPRKHKAKSLIKGE